MKRFHWGLILVTLVLVLATILGACAPATTPGTTAPTTTAPGTKTPTSTATATSPGGTTATTTVASGAKPDGEVIAASIDLSNETFIPWQAQSQSFLLIYNVYDVLIYYNETDNTFIPGLATSWEVSQDLLTTTFHLRKGVQFHDGYGEFTSADVKYTFERLAGKDSVVTLATFCRNIVSMATPDPYTISVTFKTPTPVFWMQVSLGVGGQSGQPMVSKKYFETVGDKVAAAKPCGTGPYQLIESKLGYSYRFQAYEDNWRVVPEFKYITIRIMPEMSSVVAALKTRSIDMALISAELMPSLKAAGISAEASPYGGATNSLGFGGMITSVDSRYKAGYSLQDPWTDIKVREAMNISIDRQAIVDAIYLGTASAIGSTIITPDMDKWKYPFDPVRAKRLLIEAGYPNGFSFNLYSWARPGMPELPRVFEAVGGYWNNIGLKPKIVISDFAIYQPQNYNPGKTAGNIAPYKGSQSADTLQKTFALFVAEGTLPLFVDETTTKIFTDGNKLSDPAARAAATDKMMTYLRSQFAPIPLVRIAFTFAWNGDKIAPFPFATQADPFYFEYMRHAKPLNTFRLFTPWPGR